MWLNERKDFDRGKIAVAAAAGCVVVVVVRPLLNSKRTWEPVRATSPLYTVTTSKVTR